MSSFDRWPFRYLFPAVDVVMIALFGASGGWEVFRELFSSDGEEERGPDYSLTA